MLSRIPLICIFVLGAAVAATFSAPAYSQQPKPPILCADDQNECEASTDRPNSIGMKWHPGHYVKTQGNHCDNPKSYYAGVQANLDKYVERSDKFAGALISYGWGALEVDRGKYDWSQVHDHLNWLAARNKYLVLSVEPKCFNGEFNPEWLVPENLERIGDGYEDYGHSIVAATWRNHVMDQAIQFWRAFAQEFDGHPNLEMVSFGSESCPSWGQRPGGAPSDYNDKDALAQQIRLYNAMASAFSRTSITGPWNCNQGGTILDGVEALYQHGMGVASPDLCVDEGYRVFMGENGAKRDYRRKIPYRPIVSQPNLGGKDSILPLSSIQRCIDASASTHVAWVLSGTTPGATVDDIVFHIGQAGNGVYADCPTQYESMHGGCQN